MHQRSSLVLPVMLYFLILLARASVQKQKSINTKKSHHHKKLQVEQTPSSDRLESMAGEHKDPKTSLKALQLPSTAEEAYQRSKILSTSPPITKRAYSDTNLVGSSLGDDDGDDGFYIISSSWINEMTTSIPSENSDSDNSPAKDKDMAVLTVKDESYFGDKENQQTHSTADIKRQTSSSRSNSRGLSSSPTSRSVDIMPKVDSFNSFSSHITAHKDVKQVSISKPSKIQRSATAPQIFTTPQLLVRKPESLIIKDNQTIAFREHVSHHQTNSTIPPPIRVLPFLNEIRQQSPKHDIRDEIKESIEVAISQQDENEDDRHFLVSLIFLSFLAYFWADS